jgi:hypothetical protein
MRESLTPEVVANEVSMLRAGMKGPIVLVEGDTDTRLYRKFMLPAPHVRLTHCDGKPVLLQTMGLLRKRGIRQVLGICDADFDRIIGQNPHPDVMYTDFHDAEMMIVYSPSFRYVCEELYERSLSDHAFQARRDDLLGISRRIGALRMWNNTNHGQLDFKAVNPGQFLRNDGDFFYDEYSSKLLENSGSSGVSLETVLKIMKRPQEGISDGQISSGHDFAALLDQDAALKTQRDTYGGEAVEKMLRVSFDASSFARTDLLLELREWEDREDIEVLADELAT